MPSQHVLGNPREHTSFLTPLRRLYLIIFHYQIESARKLKERDNGSVIYSKKQTPKNNNLKT